MPSRVDNTAAGVRSRRRAGPSPSAAGLAVQGEPNPNHSALVDGANGHHEPMVPTNGVQDDTGGHSPSPASGDVTPEELSSGGASPGNLTTARDGSPPSNSAEDSATATATGTNVGNWQMNTFLRGPPSTVTPSEGVDRPLPLVLDEILAYVGGSTANSSASADASPNGGPHNGRVGIAYYAPLEIDDVVRGSGPGGQHPGSG